MITNGRLERQSLECAQSVNRRIGIYQKKMMRVNFVEIILNVEEQQWTKFVELSPIKPTTDVIRSLICKQLSDWERRPLRTRQLRNYCPSCKKTLDLDKITIRVGLLACSICGSQLIINKS